MADKSVLTNVLSLEIYYGYLCESNGTDISETNSVMVGFSDKSSADEFYYKALAYYSAAHFVFLTAPSPSFYDEEGVYYLQLRLNPHYLKTGARGVDILESLNSYFSNLPDELIISVYDKDAPGLEVKNFFRLPFSERHLIRQPLSTFKLEVEIRRSELGKQLTALLGSPVTVIAVQSNQQGDELKLTCSDTEAALILRSRLFDLANRANKFHLIGFKPTTDMSDCSFILIQKLGLNLHQQLSNLLEAPQPSCSTENTNHHLGFFSHAETSSNQIVPTHEDVQEKVARPEDEISDMEPAVIENNINP